MNDTRDECAEELALLRRLRRSFWTGFAISFVACWIGYELGHRERCS